MCKLELNALYRRWGINRNQMAESVLGQEGYLLHVVMLTKFHPW